jgi:hypothetical protein
MAPHKRAQKDETMTTPSEHSERQVPCDTIPVMHTIHTIVSSRSLFFSNPTSLDTVLTTPQVGTMHVAISFPSERCEGSRQQEMDDKENSENKSKL